MESKVPHKKLRIGLILNSPGVPAWQYSTIESISSSSYAEIVLLLLQCDSYREDGNNAEHGSFYRAFRNHEKKRKHVLPDACLIQDAAKLLSGAVHITLPAKSVHQSDSIFFNFFNEIQNLNIDVLVCLADGNLANVLARTSRHEFWYFQHSYQDCDRTDYSSVGFWEVIKRKPYITSKLVVRRNGLSSDELAYVTRSGARHISHSRTRNEHLWKLGSIIPRVLEQRHNDEDHQFSRSLRRKTKAESLEKITPAKRLNNIQLAIPLLSYFAWRLRQKFARRVWSKRWHLMYSLTADLGNLSRFTTMTPPKDKFWADPFILEDGDTYYLFIEEAELATGIGHISVIEMNGDGKFEPPVAIIKRPYHLSYPFVFEFEGSKYLIPESAESNRIELYRCVEFPYNLEFDRDLMKNVSAYDTTLWEENGIWWMFTNISAIEGASSWDELSLFHSDSPLSENWCPHPMNPIISDVRYARPAGALYRESGHLYRPSQNSSNHYGYGLNINRIIELSKSDFREELVHAYKPDWTRSVAALHTYNRSGKLTIIDAIRKSRKD